MKNRDENLLVKCFNNRDTTAFGEVYSLLYKELYFFASKIYKNTAIDANDVLHDIFIKLWSTEKQTFESIVNIKAYIYISLKNHLRNSIEHKKTIDKYVDRILNDNDYFIVQVAEIETSSLINEATNALPEECAKVFKLYLEGWSIKEIAQKLGKTESTVYTQRKDAISIIKTSIKKNILISLLM